MPLDATAAARLVKLLGMTGSDYDGEALAAIRKANDLLKAAGMTWGDIIAVEPEPATAPGTWQEPFSVEEAVVICLELVESPLSEWHIRFLHGIYGRQNLTEKQAAQLERIVSVCRLHARTAAKTAA